MFLPLHDTNPVKHIEFPYVNYGLIGVTTLVFFVQLATGDPTNADMTVRFGMIPMAVRDAIPNPTGAMPDEVSLFSYAFMHAGWLHLLSNMLFLWIFGDNVEDALGHFKYLLFYLACAALAACAHMLAFWNSAGPLIGASGAVAGVMGAYVLLYPHAKVFVLARIVIPIPLPLPAFWMLGFWLATQIFYAVTAPEDLVAWWAHIGGMAAGFVLAAILKRKEVPFLGGR